MRALCHDWPSCPARSCRSADHRAVPTSCCRAADTGRGCRGRLGGLAHQDLSLSACGTPVVLRNAGRFHTMDTACTSGCRIPGAWLDVVQQMNASEHILRSTPELEALMPGTVETGLLWMNMPPAQIPRRSRTVRGGPAQTTTSCARVGPSIWTNAPSSSWKVHGATRVYPAARRLDRAIAVHVLHRQWRARSSARPDSPSQRSSWTGSRS